MVQRSIDDEIQNPGDSSFASVIRAARARAVAVRPDRPVEVNFAERGELISPARVFPVHKQLSPIHRCLPESISGIEDRVSPRFKKFHDLLHLISLDAHFIQRFAKVPKEPIKMPVV